VTATADIIALERRWVEIYKRNDAEAFAELLADDFVYTSPVGEVVPRQTYIDNLGKRVVIMSAVEASDEEVRLHGDVAVVTATWTVDEAYRGTPFKGSVRLTRVWLRDAAEWRALAFQVTAVGTGS
jgi:ketosteroid isomerase-like protein